MLSKKFQSLDNRWLYTVYSSGTDCNPNLKDGFWFLDVTVTFDPFPVTGQLMLSVSVLFGPGSLLLH